MMAMVLQTNPVRKMKPMKMNKLNIRTTIFAAIAGLALFFSCKDDEDIFPKTRLFRPVLSTDLKAEGNTIIVNMGQMKEAVSYTLEISRDTFKTIEYTIESDTNYIVINEELLNGDPLFWNMLYQLRATAHAEDPQYDSKISDLGSIRTERFPTILNTPASYDVIDIKARVTWTVSGEKVTRIVLFASNDLKLTTPLMEFDVPAEDQEDGETFIDGLTPSTSYQLAIYSGDNLRGWVDYTTLVKDIDPSAAGVVDIRENTAATAVADAVAAAADGAIILVKRGMWYDMPNVPVNKSITIQAAHGFEPNRTVLFNTNGNWNIATGSTIDHIRFVDLELRGGNFGGTYVFNPDAANISVNEILFDNCAINTMRGIMRIRNSNVLINNFKIVNCQVDSIGSYGIFTADTNPNGPPSTTARVNNIVLQNSTFNRIQTGITSRNNSESIVIDGCTFSNIIAMGTGSYLIYYRGGDGNNNVANGITISNSIFGSGWNMDGRTTGLTIRGKSGVPGTPINVVNTYGTSDLAFEAGYEIAGLPSRIYSGKQDDLWVSPSSNNFNFKDKAFSGRFSVGDPRWRLKP
jgi:hypothetical protein